LSAVAKSDACVSRTASLIELRSRPLFVVELDDVGFEPGVGVPELALSRKGLYLRFEIDGEGEDVNRGRFEGGVAAKDDGGELFLGMDNEYGAGPISEA
jgi:hypothetical protein